MNIPQDTIWQGGGTDTVTWNSLQSTTQNEVHPKGRAWHIPLNDILDMTVTELSNSLMVPGLRAEAGGSEGRSGGTLAVTQVCRGGRDAEPQGPAHSSL